MTNEKTVLVKIGGAALQDEELVTATCASLALMRSLGVPLVIVHGGGPLINRELERRGIAWSFVDGQRVTTDEMMEVVEMVLCGSVNPGIVRALGKSGVRAVGLSGADGRMLVCRQADPRLGRVGTIEKVNVSPIRSVQKAAIPVIAPVGITPEGLACNVNADWAAAHVARALGIRKLVFLTDQEGILDEDGRAIDFVDSSGLENLIDRHVVQGGMLTKTRTILSALAHGVERVSVLNARRPGALFNEIVNEMPGGTTCVKAESGHRAAREGLRCSS